MEVIMIAIVTGGVSSMLIILFMKIRGEPLRIIQLIPFLRRKSNRKNNVVNQQQNTHASVKSKEKNFEQMIIDYDQYTMTRKEKIGNTLLASSFLFLIGFSFYQNFWLASLFAGLGFYYPKMKQKSLIRRRKEHLNLQFKQALYSLSSSLSAGKSVENSFREVSKDLRFLYPDPNTYIIKEFDIMTKRINNGENIERVIQDLASRSGIEDIQNFADVFSTCKRTGGDLIEVIRRTSEIISEKLDIQQEILVSLAQKRLESNILLVAPIIIVAGLSVSSPDYMEPLYAGGLGTVVMTISLVLLIIAYIWVKKIMDIKV